jgi:predicted metalloprotease with PDZ domain
MAPRKIFHASLKIPAASGDLTLYYPKWIPGEHAPDGPIDDLAGLKFSARGKTLKWRRDLLDGFTIHVEVPAGETEVSAELDFLSPATFEGGFSAGSSATDKLAVISWNQVLLYPKGWKSDDINYSASLKLPEGWKFGTPLPVTSQNGNESKFGTVSLTTLVDSPVITGEFLKVVPLAQNPTTEMDIAADSAAALDAPKEVWDHYVSLVDQAQKLFGAHHYRDYHFLYTLSDHVAHFGLEHHESNDSRLPENALVGPGSGMALGGLLAHEFAHSWNGKFRRPADLTVPYYEQPMKTDLLWGYEGLTDYLGPLLAARSGLFTPEQYHEWLAGIAAALGPGRPGRTWRPLRDTADAEFGMGFGARGWLNWRRGTDYYDEGDLVWLEVATIIHRESHGTKSIDDFCHAFHGGANNGPEVKAYTFDQLVSDLNAITPFDWTTFFHTRLDSTSPQAPVGGIENGGWKVTYTDQPTKLEGRRGSAGSVYSIGLQVGADGTVSDSIVGGAAFEAGISSGMKIVGVNGRVFNQDLLSTAIKDAKTNEKPITLLVVVDEFYRTCTINYHDGLRYPHLVREEGKPDYLDELIKARAGQ